MWEAVQVYDIPNLYPVTYVTVIIPRAERVGRSDDGAG